MERQRFVRDFGRYTPEMLSKMKEDLSITMPVGALGFCASYYKKELRRDPTIEELLLLDGLFQKASEEAEASSLCELLTNDDFVAGTYADLMNKRNACAQNPKAPLSLSELSTVASRYLIRSGKPLDKNTPILSLEDVLLSPIATTDDICLTPRDSRFRLRICNRPQVTPSAGDWVVLIRPALGQTMEDYHFTIGKLFEDRTILENLHSLCVVSGSGLLRALLKIASGLTLDLSFLSNQEEAVRSSSLNDGFVGEFLLRIPRTASALFRNRAEALGLRVAVFGTTAQEERFTILRSKNTLFGWKTAFLRSLVALSPIHAHLKNENGLSCPVKASTGSALQNPYLMKTVGTSLSLCRTVGARLFSCASIAANDSFFLNSLYATLAPVCALAASGCSYEKQELSFGIAFPKKEETDACGELISTLLGIYRAQAELAIPSNAVSFLEDQTLSHPTLTVFADADGRSVSTRFTIEGSRVYLLQPTVQKNGLPDFDSLREMLASLCEQSKNGSILSARVLCNGRLPDAIAEMESEELSCNIEMDEPSLERTCPLGVLIETTLSVDAPLIGCVKKKDVEQAPIPTSMSRLPATLPLWSDVPEIVLLTLPRDSFAYALAKELECRGAKVRVFATDCADASALPRAILSARALLLCRDVPLPRDEKTTLALSLLRHAGGVCIALGTKESDVDLAFENGLTEEDLARLCAI